MNSLLTSLCLLAVLAFPMAARAQSCTALVNTMINNWQGSQLKTTVTLMSHQANGLSAYSGAHAPVAGAPQYEARLVWNGNWMTTAVAGGVRGQMQFNDRYNTAITPSDRNNYSVDPPHLDTLEIYVSTYGVYILNLRWGNWIIIPNPQCANGVMYGLGDPIGNTNMGRKAMWVLSFGTSAQ